MSCDLCDRPRVTSTDHPFATPDGRKLKLCPDCRHYLRREFTRVEAPDYDPPPPLNERLRMH